MHSFFEKRKWNDKRDTPQASLAPCRLHFLMFSALHAEKAALLRRKNAFGRTTAFLAPRMPSQNKKAIPYGMTFCFGGDKRDRTADLMTASCYRFVILGAFASNASVLSVKSTGFCKVLSIASTRFRALLGHNLGQGRQVDLEIFAEIEMERSLSVADTFCLMYSKGLGGNGRRKGFSSAKLLARLPSRFWKGSWLKVSSRPQSASFSSGRDKN